MVQTAVNNKITVDFYTADKALWIAAERLWCFCPIMSSTFVSDEVACDYLTLALSFKAILYLLSPLL